MITVAREIHYIVGGEKKFTRDDLEDTLCRCDKDLFVQFRDKKITFD